MLWVAFTALVIAELKFTIFVQSWAWVLYPNPAVLTLCARLFIIGVCHDYFPVKKRKKLIPVPDVGTCSVFGSADSTSFGYATQLSNGTDSGVAHTVHSYVIVK